MSAEKVVIVHGFGAHRWLMVPLARRVRRAGYATLNWGYRSFFRDIETHADRLRLELEQLNESVDTERLHIVAHSMGSLVVRKALLDGRIAKLHKIALLCPPNRGSHVATRFLSYGSRLSRTFSQLSDRPDGFAKSLPTTLGELYEVAIIAAERDFVVQLESTRLPNATQHIVVPGFHSSMLFQAETAQRVLEFLADGTLSVTSDPDDSLAAGR